MIACEQKQIAVCSFCTTIEIQELSPPVLDVYRPFMLNYQFCVLHILKIFLYSVMSIFFELLCAVFLGVCSGKGNT